MSNEIVPQVIGECKNWPGKIGKNGYGNVSMTASRFVYLMEHKSIPNGHVIDHICMNRKCVNLDHLRAITIGENTLYSNKCGSALNARKTHCFRGHPLSGDNLLIQKNKGKPRRVCRKCLADHHNKWKKDNKERFCKTCPMCHKKFTTHVRMAKFCSRSCKSKHVVQLIRKRRGLV